ncbi:phytochelatin synthase family protein [Paraburkholderia fynbosensis]|uniref:glutathione gamma-glutamylcysteinyltransferase n=1 Tax=Paraburkholderia fynbosensis TaxID=1200993 RepID=A0A6J5GBH1_9BURK|nr:phytochelatin synthase family protein [Paraburkholderia fynbosensis]CAB3793517.1 hypothetical protein LMG27177_03439 [Paraburkholderia fynbosensis]
MSRYSSMRAVGRISRAVGLVTVATAALAACAPWSPDANHGLAQTRSAAQVSGQSAVQAAAPQAAQAAHSADGPLPVPPNLIPLTLTAGQKRLMSTPYSQSYWPLSQYFETQRSESWCSVAASVMVLNALGVRRPESSLYPDFPFFSQQDFFRGIDPQVADPARVSKEGMTLDQLSAVLRTFPLEVTTWRASDMTLDQFRQRIRDTTVRQDRFALLNFRRVEIGEKGGGHWSPLAAYDAASDSALLLDVARYKYPAVWVPVAQLYAGALAVDQVSGLSRGLVIVSGRAK